MSRRSAQPQLTDTHKQWVSQWCADWQVPALSDTLKLGVSSRMTASLGRCYPQRPEIRIAAMIMSGDQAIIREVLCHETAHAAVYARYGAACAPHGREWQALMAQAGFTPRARIPERELQAQHGVTLKQPSLWRHHCRRCKISQNARRPVYQWRCAACLRAGRHGKLEVNKLP